MGKKCFLEVLLAKLRTVRCLNRAFFLLFLFVGEKGANDVTFLMGCKMGLLALFLGENKSLPYF